MTDQKTRHEDPKAPNPKAALVGARLEQIYEVSGVGAELRRMVAA